MTAFHIRPGTEIDITITGGLWIPDEPVLTSIVMRQFDPFKRVVRNGFAENRRLLVSAQVDDGLMNEPAPGTQ